MKLIVLTLVLGAACFCGASPITYDVNLTVGTASVTGDIVTDGTIGILSTSSNNILDWNVVLNDPTMLCDGLPCKVDLHGPQGSFGPDGIQEASVSGTDLSATATRLLFNFSGTDGGFFFLETGDLGAVCFESTFDCLSRNFGAGRSVYIDPGFSLPFGTDFQLTSLSGTQVIATAGPAIPEPSTLALLGGAIALIGLGLKIRLKKLALQG